MPAEEKSNLAPASRAAVEKLIQPLVARVEALERLVKAQQEVIDKLNAVYKKPWSSSGER